MRQASERRTKNNGISIKRRAGDQTIYNDNNNSQKEARGDFLQLQLQLETHTIKQTSERERKCTKVIKKYKIFLFISDAKEKSERRTHKHIETQ
jgi:hypothetical protein